MLQSIPVVKGGGPAARFFYLVATLTAFGVLGWVVITGHSPWWYVSHVYEMGWVPERWNQPVAGHWTRRFEVSSFTPCPGLAPHIAPEGEPWFAMTSAIDQELATRVWAGVTPRGDTTVFVAWYGDISPRGAYGHMGMYSRAFAVRRLASLRQAGPNDCGRAMVQKDLFAVP